MMQNHTSEYRICTHGIWDTTVPGIQFDKNGKSNYAKMFEALCKVSPRGEKGKQYWASAVERIKMQGRNRKYDCVIGVSGGTDSSYLLYVAKEKFQLRPLAVNLDNGWNSDIAVQNIKKVTNAHNIDLVTYVIDYEEVKKVMRAYMKAGLPWIDAPADHAIKAALYRIASREGIKAILFGSDFRSEGKQPLEWTYGDARQLKYIVRKFELSGLKSYPVQTFTKLIVDSLVKNIKVYQPFNSIDFDKQSAQDFLKNEFEWEYYGGHHHENIFTKFAIAFWMPGKFCIDKRIITLSAQILSGKIKRSDALETLKLPPYDPRQMERDKEYVLKKLDFTQQQFDEIWNRANKYYLNYPSYMPYIEKYHNIFVPLLKHIYTKKPSFFTERQFREKV